MVLSTVLAACADPATSGDVVEDPEDFGTTASELTGQDGLGTINAATTVNQYSALTANAAAGATTLQVTVSQLDATAVGLGPLAAGDLLMVIQMQGATINSTNGVAFGTVTALNGAGSYELVRVASINANTITIANTECGGLRNAYTTVGHAQVVRIPQYADLTIGAGGSLTGTPWDGTRGGVVAVHVGGTATIGGNGINANAIGFRGGAADNAVVMNGVTLFRSTDPSQGGEKGEGIAGDAARYDANFNGRYGRGAPANGGGGGNGHNAGGGGGANGNNAAAWTGQGVMDGTVTGAAAWALDPGFVANGNALTTSSGGGRGGYTFSGAQQNATMVAPGTASWGGDSRREVGGLGGRPLDNDPAARIFLGGGGGAGDGNNAAAGAGGRGGGIVFVLAGAVAGSGAIVANGANGGVSAGNPGDAPGGGGAGGTIIVRSTSLAGISSTANGGLGGLQTLAADLEAEGPGGGGGGGYIAVSGGAITRSATGGANGTTNRPTLTEFPANGATRGATGNAAATVGTLPACLADLAIAITDTPDPVLPGGNITYTITVTNNGPASASTLTVTDVLPAGVTFVSATGTGWMCNNAAGTVTCTRPTLATGAAPVITLVVTAGAGGGTISNTVRVTAATSDPSTLNNSATATTGSSNTNDPPVNALPAAQTVAEDATLSLTGGSRIQISDPDAGAAAVRVQLTATNGVLTLNTAGLTFTVGDGTSDATMTFTGTIAAINTALGTLVYAPSPDYNGPAQVTIVTNDQGNTGTGGAQSDTDTLAITVTPVNDAPTALDDTAVVMANAGPTPIPVLANDTIAPDTGETLTITAVTQPAGGTVLITGGGTGISFTPDPGFRGTATFTYTVSDGNGGTAIAMVTIMVTGNLPPIALDDLFVIAEDAPATAVPVLANDTTLPDVGETLTITAVTQPANGVVAITGGGTGLTFRPNTSFNGVTTFTYTVSDGMGGTDTATVSVTVTPVNDNPNANDDTATIPEDAAATPINVRGNDTIAPDTGETLTVTAVTQPANGTVVITGGGTGVSFTPAPNFSGTTTFTYTISDGNGGTDTATVTVTVSPMNDNPTANDDTATVAFNSAATAIPVLANDTIAPDAGETLSITAVTQAANGTVAITGGGTGLTFRPTTGFTGTTTFTYTVSDGNGGTDTAMVTVSVTQNNPPAANDDTATLAEDAAATAIPVLANDSTAPDVGETLSITAVTQPANGTVVITGGGTGLTFQPAANFNGTTTFTYTVSDGNSGMDTATVTVTVTPVNDNPDAVDDTATVSLAGGAQPIPVLANDTSAPDTGETLTITAITQPTSGTVTITGGGTGVSYTPAAGGPTGTFTFTYTISDGNGGTDTATVTVTVAGNAPPVATDDTVAVDEDSTNNPLTVLANDTSAPDIGETLTITSVTQPPNGSASVNGIGTIINFTPTPNFFGTTAFTYTISDGNGGTDTATVTVMVIDVNDPPTAVDDSASLAVDAPPTVIEVLANDTSAPDGPEPLILTAITQPATGGTATIDVAGQTITFAPAAGFDGLATFTYTIRDDNGATATANVFVSIGEDTDGDGLGDDYEDMIGTDPMDADSDDDGVIDGDEPAPGTDTDGDGLIDALDPDSDNDGLYDGTELGVTTPDPDTDVTQGHFIPDADPTTTTDPRDADTDDGGVIDGAEDVNGNGEVDAGEIDPNNGADDVTVTDTDGDGLPDATEIEIGTDPNDADSDDDGIVDGAEPNYRDDTDGDGDINALDPDSDNDGLKDGTEMGVTMPHPDTDTTQGNFVPDMDPSTTTSPVDPDTDDGGVPDGIEDTDHDGQVDPGERDPNNPADDMQPLVDDTDNDGVLDDLDNCVEVANTDQADQDSDTIGDACDPDADGNGFADNVGVSGGGCATSGSPSAALPFLLALGVLLAKRRRKAALVAATLIASTGIASAQAVAEPRNFSVERFQLATDRMGILSVEGAVARGAWAFDVAFWIGYANDPLVVYADMGDGRDRIGSLISDRTGAGLTAAVSPTTWLELGFELPLVLSQDRSSNMAIAPDGLQSLNSFGVGDLRLVPKLAFLRQEKHGIGLALVPAIELPTRNADDQYLADRGVTFEPHLALSKHWTGWRFGMNVGYRARKRSELLDLVVDDELFGRVGLGYNFGGNGGPPLAIDAALSVATAATEPFGEFNRDHIEALAGPSVTIAKKAILFAIGGVGLQEGFGTPDWRILAGLRIGTGEQIVEPEPEIIPEPPVDPDRDDDGIYDVSDSCVDVPGIAELKGCPPKDTDGDTLMDHKDQCPEVAEDVDGFQDEDGCLDPDNDSDTVLDVADRCVNEPGIPQNEGCPDTDLDGDTVVDRLDNCPDVKGLPKYQGCPKKQLVTITDDRLEILESVYFKLNKAIILKKSNRLLDNVASVLSSHPNLVVEVQGHTDSQGNDAYNKDLSQRRADAVRAYLINQGIDGSRLTAVGFGEDEPVASNESKKGRAQNRRVVFKLLGGDGKVKTTEQGAGDDTIEMTPGD